MQPGSSRSLLPCLSRSTHLAPCTCPPCTPLAPHLSCDRTWARRRSATPGIAVRPACSPTPLEQNVFRTSSETSVESLYIIFIFALSYLSSYWGLAHASETASASALVIVGQTRSIVAELFMSNPKIRGELTVHHSPQWVCSCAFWCGPALKFPISLTVCVTETKHPSQLD